MLNFIKQRSVSINHWGSELGLAVLKGLSRLYTSLVWESTVLLALCSEDTLPPGCEFGKADMARLLPPNFQQPATSGKSYFRLGRRYPKARETLFWCLTISKTMHYYIYVLNCISIVLSSRRGDENGLQKSLHFQTQFMANE